MANDPYVSIVKVTSGPAASISVSSNQGLPGAQGSPGAKGATGATGLASNGNNPIYKFTTRKVPGVGEFTLDASDWESNAGSTASPKYQTRWFRINSIKSWLTDGTKFPYSNPVIYTYEDLFNALDTINTDYPSPTTGYSVGTGVFLGLVYINEVGGTGEPMQLCIHSNGVVGGTGEIGIHSPVSSWITEWSNGTSGNYPPRIVTETGLVSLNDLDVYGYRSHHYGFTPGGGQAAMEGIDLNPRFVEGKEYFIQVVPGHADAFVDNAQRVANYNQLNSVNRFNGRTGAVGITGSANITVTPTGATFVISASGLAKLNSNPGQEFTGIQTFLEGMSSLTDIEVNGLGLGVGAGNDPLNSIYTDNIRLGTGALENNLCDDPGGGFCGSRNLAVGSLSLSQNTYGTSNIGLGYATLQWNETGVGNVAIGDSVLQYSKGNNNLGIGGGAGGSAPLVNLRSGSGNLAFGVGTLTSLTNGSYNTAIGSNALQSFLNGTQNIAIGNQAGQNTYTITGTTGAVADIGQLNDRNTSIYIGYEAGGLYVTGASLPVVSEIVIGTNGRGRGSYSTVIGGTAQTQAWIYGLLNAPNGVSANNILRLTSTPATTTSTGTTGQVALTNTDMYICTATNTWRKVALTTF